MVLIAVVAGLRVSEVLGLQPRDMDIDSQALTVCRRYYRGDVDEPKTEASQRVRFIGPLAGMLAQHARGKKPDAFLFAQADGQPPDPRDLQRYCFRPAAKAVGLYQGGFGMHTFRRLNITWKQQCGATPIEAMRSAGHTSLSQTWLYTITDMEREKEQVAKLWDRIKPAAE
jgi:integrase